MSLQMKLQKTFDVTLGLLVLFAFQLIGNLFQQFSTLPIPGVIFGMLLFFICLLGYGKVPRFIKSCTDTMLPLLPLFILPSLIGILAHGELLSTDALPLLIAITIGLILTQIITPLIFLFLMRRLINDNSESAHD